MIDHETLAKIAAGGGGSAIAAWIAKAAGVQRVIMFASGFAASYFIAPAVADYFGLVTPRAQNAVGFLVGFVAIMFLRKVHDVFEGIPAGSIGASLAEWVRKILGLPAKPEGGSK